MEKAQTPSALQLQKEVGLEIDSFAKRKIAVPGTILFVCLLVAGLLVSMINDTIKDILLELVLTSLLIIVIATCLAPKILPFKKVLMGYLKELEDEEIVTERQIDKYRHAYTNVFRQNPLDPGEKRKRENLLKEYYSFLTDNELELKVLKKKKELVLFQIEEN
jgi:hypothetical protein